VSDRQTGRRDFLGTIGTVTALASVPAVSGRREQLSFDELINRANQIRSEHNSREAWKKYLAENGVGGSSEQYSLSMEDSISTSRYTHRDQISCEFNLAVGPDTIDGEATAKYYAELNWKYLFGGFKEVCQWTPSGRNCYEKPKTKGAPPRDIVGIVWSPQEWKLLRDNLSEDTVASQHVEYEHESWAERRGLAFAMHDKAANEYMERQGNHFSTIPTDETFHAGVFLTDVGDYDEERYVRGEYHHTYNGWGINGVSIGPGGVSVGLGWETREMVTEANNYDEVLRVYQSEADRVGFPGPD